MVKNLSTAFIGNGSEMQTRVRDFDWSRTPLGAIADWPVSLRATASLMLNSKQPMFLWWGPELVQIYNDGYRPSFGKGKHPAALGQAGRECWQEIWHIISPMIDEVRSGGSTALQEDQLIPVWRNERMEDVYWTYTYNPIYDESNQVSGVLVIVTETTAKVVNGRRQSALGWLARRLRACKARQDVFDALQEAAALNTADLPAVYCEQSGSSGELAEVQIDARSLGVDVDLQLTFLLNPRCPFDKAYRLFLDDVSIAVAAALLEIEAVQSKELTTATRNQLLTNAPLGTALMTGSDLVYQLANPPYLEMIGRKKVVGMRFDEIFPELQGSPLREVLQTALETGRPYSDSETRLEIEVHGAIEERYYNFNLAPLRNPAGEIYGLMAMVLNVTGQVQARKRAEILNIELQRAIRIKDEFLAMLGHELRNPLAPIVSALEILRGKGHTLSAEHLLIQRHVEHLQRLVDDLLDISRITKGVVELRKEYVDIAELVQRAAGMTKALFQRREHRLTVNVPSSELFCDAARIVQVLGNLLTNAARYTEPGGDIRVDALTRGGELKLVVSDNGIGMPAALLPDIFDLFTQGKRLADRSEGGLGLGLSLVRNLVGLHGGSVSAASAGKDCGSSFTIILPLDDADSAAPAPLLPEQVATKGSHTARLLLVDDNVDAVDLLAQLLTLKGNQVEVAYEPLEAIAIFGRQAFDIAILDIGLPTMDGYQLLDQLRSMPDNSDCRFISLSGYGQARDREKSLASGFVQHLVKPVTSSDLLTVLEILQDTRS